MRYLYLRSNNKHDIRCEIFTVTRCNVSLVWKNSDEQKANDRKRKWNQEYMYIASNRQIRSVLIRSLCQPNKMW